VAFTAQQFRQAWQRIAGLAMQANNARLRATLILMGWSVDSASGRNWRDYYPGRQYVDVLGWDLYNPRWEKGGVRAGPGSVRRHPGGQRGRIAAVRYRGDRISDRQWR
jgi:hypothetical protein